MLCESSSLEPARRSYAYSILSVPASTRPDLAFGGQLISSVTLVAAAQLCLSGSMPVGAFVGLVSTMKRTTTSLPKASLRGL